jgi:hypothetical protein
MKRETVAEWLQFRVRVLQYPYTLPPQKRPKGSKKK